MSNLAVNDAVDEAEAVIPLASEEVTVSTRVVPRGRVRVSRVTHSHEQMVEALLGCDGLEIERTLLNTPIDAVPPVRQEPDSIVIPVVEEIVRVERRLILKEEVRVRRVRRTEAYRERVTLRTQEAVVNRLAVDGQEPPPALNPGNRSVSEPKEHL